MNLPHNRLDILEKELEKLPPFHRIAFAAAACERLYPNYGVVVREMKQMIPDEPNHMRIALDKIWAYLAGEKVEAETFCQLIYSCEEYSRYEDMGTAESQRASWAIMYALELCLEPTVKNAISVFRQVQDTLYEYIDCEMDNNDPNWDKTPYQEREQLIYNHPFIIREMAKQSEELQRLKDTSILNRQTLKWLRTFFNNQGKSLIDLC